MDFETINFEINERVGIVTMNRPDEANALNAQMAKELFEVSVQCSRNKNLGALIITANGKMFNAGGDLKEFNNPPGNKKDEHLSRVASNLHDALIRFAYMDAPVIMAVNGTAAGGGFSLALSGDYILASDNESLANARVLTAGDGITISTATPREITINSNGLISRSTTFHDITASHAESKKFDVHGVNFATSGYDFNKIDVLVNGQTLRSGSNHDYVLNGTGSITFEFALEADDVVQVITF